MIRAKEITILGIETSCDETAAAIVRCRGGLAKPKFKILSNIVSSQVKLHAEWGGVVPNLAKREHIKNLPRVLERAFKEAFPSIKMDTASRQIDAIAVTVGPGLEPALWTGINFARELNLTWNMPLVAANHMEGHFVSPLLVHGKENSKLIKFPALALLVSGGHTELVLAKKWLDYKIIGETLDDAVGEVFDKVARMLKLGYPGGPAISKLSKDGDANSIQFPRPMMHAKNYNFSFSGLKTAVLYHIRDNGAGNKADIASSFQQAAIDVLIAKTLRAASEYKIKSLILGGGVAANAELRGQLARAVKKNFPKLELHVPHIKFTGDNAAMIAAASYFHLIKKHTVSRPLLRAKPHMAI